MDRQPQGLAADRRASCWYEKRKRPSRRWSIACGCRVCVDLSANRDLPPTDGRQNTRRDLFDLRIVQSRPQLPTMEIWAADGCPKLEVRCQSAHDAAHRMNVVAQVIDHFVRFELFLERAKSAALTQPPVRRSDIELLAVELIDHENPARIEERREMSTRRLERIHMVQGDHRDAGVEPPMRIDEADSLNRAIRLGRWIDGGHIVAYAGQSFGKLATSRSDLEDASRRGRK